MTEVDTAIRLQPKHTAPYFYGGIVRFKLGDYRIAFSNFRRCLHQTDEEGEGEGEHQLDAELNIWRVQA